MDIKVRQEGPVTVVDLSGPITLGKGDAALRAELFNLLARNRKQIVLDLTRVPHIDSAGLGELGASFKRAREKAASSSFWPRRPRSGACSS